MTVKLSTRVANLIHDGRSQDANDLFGEALGIDRAERLSRLWSNTYDNRSAYDKLMGYGRSKAEVFAIKAERDGYTSDEVKSYCSL